MTKNHLAPIVLFAYNRPFHLKETLNALIQNKSADKSTLIVYSDGPKNDEDKLKVDKVRNHIRKIKGFKDVQLIERKVNLGLSKNIINGVTEIVNSYGHIIVLEDDLISSPYFLNFMNEGLDKFEYSDNVISVSGYFYPIKKKVPDTFFIKGADCLGWATWKNKWKRFEPEGEKLLHIIEGENLISEFDFNNAYPFTQMLRDQIAGINNSWAIRWYASAFINGLLTLYPGNSLISHIGNDGSGTNFGKSDILDVKISEKPVVIKSDLVEEDRNVRHLIEKYLKSKNAGILKIIYRKLRKYLKSNNLAYKR